MAQTQQETPSPLVNQLLQLVRAANRGEHDVEELAELVDSQLSALEQARVQTAGRFEEQGPEHLERFGAHFEALMASFDDLRVGLEGLQEWCNTGEGLEEVEAGLIRGAFSSKYAMDMYQRAELDAGPTDMPLLNLIIRMKDGYVQQAVPKEAFVDVLDGASRMAQDAVTELKAARGEHPPELFGLVRAYEDQISQLELAVEALDQGPEEVEEAVGRLITTSVGIRDAMMALSEAKMRGGPCRLERTNIFLSTASIYREGGMDDEGFTKVLESFMEELEAEHKELEQVAILNTSESLDDQLERVNEAYALHAEALDLFETLTTRMDEYFNARDKLIAASEMLSDCKEAFEKIAEREGKVICVRCSTPNEPGSKVCVNCGAQLPQEAGVGQSTLNLSESGGEVVTGELEITENLRRLFEGVNAVVEGEMGAEEFEEVLLWMDGLLKEGLVQLPDPPRFKVDGSLSEESQNQVREMEQALAEERNNVQEGLQDFREALGRMQLFLDDDDPQHLVQGIGHVRDASIKIQQAEKRVNALTEAVRKAMEESR